MGISTFYLIIYAAQTSTLFTQPITKFSGQSTTISNCIDGEVGAQNIAYHFQEIYINLYSQHTVEDKVQQNIQERVHHGLQDENH